MVNTEAYAKETIKALEKEVKELQSSLDTLLYTYQQKANTINSIIVKLAASPTTIRRELANLEQGTKMGDGQMIKNAREVLSKSLNAIIESVQNYKEQINNPLHELLDAIQNIDNKILELKQPRTPLQPALQKLFDDVQIINEDIVSLKAHEREKLRTTGAQDYNTLIQQITVKATTIKNNINKITLEIAKEEFEILIKNVDALRTGIPFTDQYIQTTLARQAFTVISELKRLLEIR